MTKSEDCLYCDRRAGRADEPPGGYVYEDDHWLIGHAIGGSTAGSLIVEARRHALDFGEMNDDEAASFGRLLRRLYPVIKESLGAERVYLVSTMAFYPHFHAWLVPWHAGTETRGMDYLVHDGSFTVDEAATAAAAVRDGIEAASVGAQR